MKLSKRRAKARSALKKVWPLYATANIRGSVFTHASAAIQCHPGSALWSRHATGSVGLDRRRGI